MRFMWKVELVIVTVLYVPGHVNDLADMLY